MIVQVRTRSLRLIRQHDHALASGRLAHAWVGFGDEPAPLSHGAVLGTALHDWAWHRADREPVWDPGTRQPFGFETHPVPERLRFYAEGVTEVEEIDPYAGLLASLHYSTFVDTKGTEESARFLAKESERQERLHGELGLTDRDLPRVESDRVHLRLFDNLSLFACLTGPGIVSPPSWLDARAVGKAPDGHTFELRWEGAGVLRIAPFPFRGEVELALPARDLERRDWDAESLRAAWRDTPAERHRLTVKPG